MTVATLTGRMPGLLGRAIQWPASRIFLALLVIGAAVNAVRWGLTELVAAFTGQPLRQDTLLYAVSIILVTHAAYVLFVRSVERRRAAELAMAGAARELGLGVLIGAGLFAITIGTIALLGYYRVTGVNGWAAVAAPLAMALGSGYAEEIIFRGVFFRIVEEGLGTWIALLLSSAFFGLVHMANPNASPASAVAIMLEAGVLLGAAFILTRRLWLAIGIHFAWNFTQGGIFGVNVSGYEFAGYLRSELSGPDLLSGGSRVGAEGSVFALIFCLAVATWFLVVSRRRGRFVAPFWKRPGRTVPGMAVSDAASAGGVSESP